MPNLDSVLKEEIRRLARKEIKGAVDQLKKAATVHRQQIAKLKQQVVALERQAKRTTRGSPAPTGIGPGRTGKRFQIRGLISHRKMLGLSAEAYGKLVGVSGQTIYKWEQGKAKPRAKQVESLIQFRELGKREAALLAQTVQ